MAQVSLPYTLTAGTPENVNNLMSNLNALVAGVNTIDTAQIASGSVSQAKLAAGVYVPIGGIVQFGGSSAPSNWVLCDGSAVSRTTYADLFTALSTTYGAGDGSTTFNVPDLRGRMAVGKGTNADVDALGDNDGASLANRSPKHQHTVYDPGHGHSINEATTNFIVIAGRGVGAGNLAASGTTVNRDTSGLGIASNTTGAKVNPQGASSSSSPTDTPAYVVVNYIIRAL